MLITILVLIVILGILVFVHELGHFLAAKMTGVKVEEFAFGFRPRLWSKKIGETEYAINAIPLGGYVRLYGEDLKEKGKKSLSSQSFSAKIFIMVAGVMMNLILGWIILTVLFIVGFNPLIPGTDRNVFVHEARKVQIVTIAVNSPAALAGIKENDQVIAVGSVPVANDYEFVNEVNAHRGQTITLKLLTSGSERTVQLIPRETPPKGEGAIGVGIETIGKVKTSVWLAPLAGLYETGRLVGMSVAGFFGFVKDLIVHQKVSEDVTGIVGVGVLTGIARRLPFEYLAQLVMVVTIGLGVVQLVPMMPLDGGQVVNTVYEKIFRRQISEKALGIYTTIGLSLVILLFVVVTYKDVVRFDILGRILHAL